MRTTIRTASMNGADAGSAAHAAEEWSARVASITADDFAALMDPTDHSMALMFERFYVERLHTSPGVPSVKSWNGLVWEGDGTQGRRRDAAIETVETLIAAADSIPIPAGSSPPDWTATRPRTSTTTKLNSGGLCAAS